MNKTIWGILAVIAIMAASGAGYWLGTRHAGVQPAAAPEPAKVERKILYYRNPMGLPDTSPTPKKDSMGMDYVPVYADEAAQGAQNNLVSLSPDRVQKLGVRTEAAAVRDLTQTVRAVGRFEADESRMHTVSTKFEGWIERLHVNTIGQPVGRGQPLMEVYSPELVSAQQEYLIAWNGREALKQGTQDAQSGVDRLADGALQRLRYWDISEAQLRRLQQTGKATRTLTIYAPASGVVMEKTAVSGMRFMPGDALYKISDLSRLWLIADVFEQDLAGVRVGQTAQVSVDAFPGKVISGKVTFIYPTFNPETRTAQVRVELPNPGGLLKPAMFGNVELAAGGKTQILAVPASAVLNSGTRQVVLVQVAEGRFEPRVMKLGQLAGDYVQVLDGVAEGEQVVVSANFLIDAESNLKAALGSLNSQPKEH